MVTFLDNYIDQIANETELEKVLILIKIRKLILKHKIEENIYKNAIAEKKSHDDDDLIEALKKDIVFYKSILHRLQHFVQYGAWH